MQGHKVKEDGKYGLKYCGDVQNKVVTFYKFAKCNLSTFFEKCCASQKLYIGRQIILAYKFTKF